MVPRETVSFVFPRVLIVEGNIRTRGKTKLTSFPREHALSAIYLDFPLSNHIAITQNIGGRTSLFTIVNPA